VLLFPPQHSPDALLTPDATPFARYEDEIEPTQYAASKRPAKMSTDDACLPIGIQYTRSSNCHMKKQPAKYWTRRVVVSAPVLSCTATRVLVEDNCCSPAPIETSRSSSTLVDCNHYDQIQRISANYEKKESKIIMPKKKASDVSVK
jgi:hypothetical protein